MPRIFMLTFCVRRRCGARPKPSWRTNISATPVRIEFILTAGIGLFALTAIGGNLDPDRRDALASANGLVFAKAARSSPSGARGGNHLFTRGINLSGAAFNPERLPGIH